MLIPSDVMVAAATKMGPFPMHFMFEAEPRECDTFDLISGEGVSQGFSDWFNKAAVELTKAGHGASPVDAAVAVAEATSTRSRWRRSKGDVSVELDSIGKDGNVQSKLDGTPQEKAKNSPQYKGKDDSAGRFTFSTALSSHPDQGLVVQSSSKWKGNYVEKLAIGPAAECLTFVVDGLYLRRSDNYALALDVERSRYTPGAHVTLFPNNLGDNQKFSLNPDGSISPAQNASLVIGCLDDGLVLVSKDDVGHRLLFRNMDTAMVAYSAMRLGEYELEQPLEDAAKPREASVGRWRWRRKPRTSGDDEEGEEDGVGPDRPNNPEGAEPPPRDNHHSEPRVGEAAPGRWRWRRRNRVPTDEATVDTTREVPAPSPPTPSTAAVESEASVKADASAEVSHRSADAHRWHWRRREADKNDVGAPKPYIEQRGGSAERSVSASAAKLRAEASEVSVVEKTPTGGDRSSPARLSTERAAAVPAAPATAAPADVSAVSKKLSPKPITAAERRQGKGVVRRGHDASARQLHPATRHTSGHTSGNASSGDEREQRTNPHGVRRSGDGSEHSL